MKSRIFDPEGENIIDISKPPLGPPLRVGNAFHMLFELNDKNLEDYQKYIEQYREARQSK